MLKNRTDKVLNNKWNLGDYEYENFGNLKIQDLGPDPYYENEERIINEEIFRIFKESPWKDIKNLEKIQKSDMLNIWIYFEENVKVNISPVDLFVYICDFFNCSYRIFYEQLPTKHKESILIDLDERTGVIKNQKIKRLF